MAEIKSEILLGRWRFRTNYWNHLSEEHRQLGNLEMWQSCKKTADIYKECADELEQALSGSYEPLESQRYRLPAEMCPEEQEALLKRHAARTKSSAQAGDAIPTMESVGQAQVEELLAKLTEDVNKKRRKVE